jgi:hypothetical protein
LIAIHSKVESRTLFDFMQGLLKFVNEKENAGKGHDGAWNLYRVWVTTKAASDPTDCRLTHHHQHRASWYLIGEIMKNMGANVSVRPVHCRTNLLISILLPEHVLHDRDRLDGDEDRQNLLKRTSRESPVAILLTFILLPRQAVIIRTSALSALAKSLSTAGKAVPETVAKDLVKLLVGKNGLSDLAGPVQRCCAEVSHMRFAAYSRGWA